MTQKLSEWELEAVAAADIQAAERQARDENQWAEAIGTIRDKLRKIVGYVVDTEAIEGHPLVRAGTLVLGLKYNDRLVQMSLCDDDHGFADNLIDTKADLGRAIELAQRSGGCAECLLPQREGKS